MLASLSPHLANYHLNYCSMFFFVLYFIRPPVYGSNGRSYSRKLCYRKDDRAMRPTYGCHENFRDSLTTSTATIPNIFMGFCSRRPYECSYKI